MKKKVLVTFLGMTMLLAGCSSTSGTSQTDTSASGSVVSSETETSSSSETAEVTELPDYTALDYVKVGEYKGLEITVDGTDVTDEDIYEAMREDFQAADLLEEVTEGKVEEGDLVDVNYTASQNSIPLTDGTVSNYDVVIGSDTFIEGFEEGLVGKEIGDTVYLTLTFPDDASYGDYAGEEADFEVTVNYKLDVPELTNKLVKKVSDCKTVKAYKKAIKEEVTQEKQDELWDNEANALTAALYDNCVISDLPEDVVEYYYEKSMANAEALAEQNGTDLESFLSANYDTDLETYEKQTKAYVQQYTVAIDVILKGVAETEGIELTDEEYQEYLQKYAEQTSTDADTLVENYSEKAIRALALQDKVLEFLLDNANVTFN